MTGSVLIDATVYEEVLEVGPATVAEIISGVGLAESTVRRSLHRLEATGRIASSGYQRRARVFVAEEDG